MKTASTEAPPDTELRGTVFDIQRMSIHDGPGIRTTVFLKGCPLECLWCHNPEGRDSRRQLAFTPALCIGCGFCFRRCPHDVHVMEDGEHRLARDRCAECFACVEECYSNALEIVGREMTVAEVIGEVLKDRVFYEESGGGITLSGGEPLMQFPFATALLRQAKAEGLHTCVETCGFAPNAHLEALIPWVDLFLFDYKETESERHKDYTEQDNRAILDNLRFIDRRGGATILRCPIVPGVNLREDHLEGIVAVSRGLRHCRGIDIIGYHPLGESKRTRLGLPPAPETLEFASMSQEEVETVAARVRALGGKNVTAF